MFAAAVSLDREFHQAVCCLALMACHQALMVCPLALMVCRPELALVAFCPDESVLALVAFCPDESVLVVCCLALKLSGEVLAMSVACEHCRA